MAKGYPVTDDEKLRILELLEEEKSQGEIAKTLGLSQTTVSRVKQEFYGKDTRSMDCVVAGDKKYGTLTATGADHYVGTCLVAGGKMKKRHFTVKGSKNAIAAWEAWKRNVGAIENDVPKKKTSEQPKVNDIPEKKETPVPNPTAHENANVATSETPEPIYIGPDVESNSIKAANANTIRLPEKSDTVYVMAVVGELKILKYFTNRALGLHAVEVANEALVFAGAEARYCLVEVEPYKPKKLAM